MDDKEKNHFTKGPTEKINSIFKKSLDDVTWDDLKFLLSEIKLLRESLLKAGNSGGEKDPRPLVEALKRLRDCDWTVSLPDRMDAMRKIAREALEAYEKEEKREQNQKVLLSDRMA